MRTYGTIYAGIGLLVALGVQGCDDPECPAGTVRLGTRCAPNVRADGGAGDGREGDGGEEQEGSDAAPRGDAAQRDGSAGLDDAEGGDDAAPSACNPNPCQHDGVCSVGEDGAQCDCVSGHGGDRCEFDPCADNPCLHETACVRVAGAAQCDCGTSGYEGAHCETDIDECATASCAEAYPCMQTAPPGYTCRGQFADWPMPDASPGAKVAPNYTVDGDVVVDQVTGLRWQAYIPANYPGCASGQPQSTCTWEQAKAYCENLAYGQRSDWRLPSAIELLTILDPTRVSPAQPEAFPATPQGLFWTSSPVAGSNGVAIAMSNAGVATVGFATDYGFLARCVRGGAPPPSGPRYRFEAGGNEVLDTRTGLAWRRSPAEQGYSWSNAVTWCQGQAGGWRLPTMKELATLVDPAKSLDDSAPVDSTAFPSIPPESFWTSSAFAEAGQTSSRSWRLDFAIGYPNVEARDTELRVLCVR